MRQHWSGTDSLSSARRVAVFVHFDPQGAVGDWLLHYLDELMRAEFRTIFVSNAPVLSDQTISRLQGHCALILRRDNIGYDFGAYKDGIHSIPDFDGLDTLLLANDSVYGPFHPLPDVLSRMSRDTAAVWGITDSLEGGHHLQSYFLLFHRAALQSRAFISFWRKHRHVQSRYWNILKYELGLTRDLQRAALPCKALCSCHQAAAIAEARQVGAHLGSQAESTGPHAPMNPTHDLWEVLIGDLGCPFIKRDMLRAGSAGTSSLGRWRALVESVSDYDTRIIPDDTSAPAGQSLSRVDE